MSWHTLPYRPGPRPPEPEVEKPREKVRGYPGWLRQQHKDAYIQAKRRRKESAKKWCKVEWSLQGEKALIHGELANGRVIHIIVHDKELQPSIYRPYKDIPNDTRRETAAEALDHALGWIDSTDLHERIAEDYRRRSAWAAARCPFCFKDKAKQQKQRGAA